MYAAPAASGREEPAEDSPVIEEIHGDVVGEQMRLVTRVYAGVSSEPIDPTWDAAKGLSAIKKGDLISEETVYVSVPPPTRRCPRPASTTPANSRRPPHPPRATALCGTA